MGTASQTVTRIKNFRKSILQRYHHKPLFSSSLADIRRVVVINSSSRSGSSLLYSLLSRLPGIYSLTGEAAPFYKLNSYLDSFNLFESDLIPSEILDVAIDCDGLKMDLFSDLYRSDNYMAKMEIDADEYIDHLILRFSLQWTDIVFDENRLRSCIARVLESQLQIEGDLDVEEFYLVLLEKMTELYPEINPFYYDIGTDRVALRFPHLNIPLKPPSKHLLLEEPPFILQQPRQKATQADLKEKTLLLKSTVDCYRMNLIEKIFPNADIRIIHLLRNPAATVNGIYDGWLHRGFFSHNLGPYFSTHDDLTELRISGYSDRFPHGSTWWNFDLPSGWQEYANRCLLDVCAFQWRSANAEILNYLSRSGKPSVRICFENMIRNLPSRLAEMENLLEFIDMPSKHLGFMPLTTLPVVQSTLPPQLYRWKKRKDLIARLLQDRQVRIMGEELGYPVVNMEEWL